MNEKNKLILQMGIFFIFVFATFTYIVLNEKKYIILSPKIEKKLNQYIDKNYSELKNELKISKMKFLKNKKIFQIKLTNNKNKDLYFTITYANKKIKDTYKNDYQQGQSLYKKVEKKYKENFQNSKLNFSKSLDKYPNTIYEKVLTENIKTLPIYDVSIELSLNNHNQKTIKNSIYKCYLKHQKLGYNPKSYNFILVDKNDITFSLNISNLTKEHILNNLDEIISAIIDDDNSIEDKYTIKYKYIN